MKGSRSKSEGRHPPSALSVPFADEQPVVFVVDDDASMRATLSDVMRSVGLQVQTFASAREFMSNKLPDAPGCLVLDVRLPGQSGLDFQRTLAGFGGSSITSRPTDTGSRKRRGPALPGLK